MSLRPLTSYATDRAVSDAELIGLILTPRDWLTVVLAITDTMDPSGARGAPHFVTARYLGPTRAHERWSVTWGERNFDVLYNADVARVEGVTDPRSPTPVTATRPRQPAGGAMANA